MTLITDIQILDRRTLSLTFDSSSGIESRRPDSIDTLWGLRRLRKLYSIWDHSRRTHLVPLRRKPTSCPRTIFLDPTTMQYRLPTLKGLYPRLYRDMGILNKGRSLTKVSPRLPLMRPH